MNNIEKKLDALIDALGFDVKTLVDRKETPIGKRMGESGITSCVRYGKTNGLVINGDGSYKRGKDECYYLKPSLNIEYKLTKREDELPLDCRVPCVPLPINSKAWGSIVEYLSDHAEDIEIGIDDFSTLRPMWEFMTGDRK
jgi:hypothetical protein